MAGLRARVQTSYSVEAELALAALVLVAWQAIRIPLEGNVDVSLAHADSVLRLQDALSLDIEQSVIAWLSEAGLTPVLAWLYTNIHVPVLFGFLAAVRMLDPGRYPRVRTIFVLSFVPAVLVIGLYPLAPPRWLPAFGFGSPPAEAELAGTTAEWMHNSTAAAASQHFGFALFIASVSLWLFPRSRFVVAAVSYPVLVFLVIVGTGNHYVVDCIVGSATFALAAVVAWGLHRAAEPARTAIPASGVAGTAIGYGLVAWALVSVELIAPRSPNNLPEALVLAAGVTAIVFARGAAKEPVAESG